MTHGNTSALAARRGIRPRPGGSRRILAPVSAAVLAPALLTACGGDSGTTTTSGGLVQVTVGGGGSIFDTPLQVADANGYFREQGLKMKCVTLTAATGPSALQSGSVQFYDSSPTAFASALAKGLHQLAVSADGLGNPLGLVVSKKFAAAHNLTAKSPAEQVAKALSGSTGGSSSANTKAEAGIFIDKYGVDPDKKVKWVSLPSPAADKAAINSGQIDWFVTSEPIPLQIQDDGDGVVVADPLNVPEWAAEDAGYGQLVVTQKSYATAPPDVVEKFATAVQQATAYMNTHLKDSNDQTVVKAAQKLLTGVPDSVVEASLQQVEWPTDGSMDAAGWKKTTAFLTSLRTLPSGAEVTTDDWTNKYLP
ncbi:ABC transporter substrate-binding protein [Streptomyces sp. enrichment culture]|uniref:ABC transporter substrate-binding protein n=1 Tax=Streptomyces sp. enrichment culture TaxID=1795815 RepID=UPI003F56295C